MIDVMESPDRNGWVEVRIYLWQTGYSKSEWFE
jgi:hypothetical protein